MAQYKYIQLSKDIERLLKHKKWHCFSRYNIYLEICLQKGFYTYSKSTFYRAIRHLIECDKLTISHFIHSNHYTYIYHKTASYPQIVGLTPYDQ